MDSDLLIIFPFVLLLLTIVGLSVNGIVSKATAYYLEKEERQHRRGQASGDAGDLAARTEMIEDRLRVLERIATDRGQLLSDEIDALRRETPQLEKTPE